MIKKTEDKGEKSNSQEYGKIKNKKEEKEKKKEQERENNKRERKKSLRDKN